MLHDRIKLSRRLFLDSKKILLRLFSWFIRLFNVLVKIHKLKGASVMDIYLSFWKFIAIWVLEDGVLILLI